LLPLLAATPAPAFLAPSPHRHAPAAALKAIAGDIDAMAEQRLDEIAAKLKLQCYDPDTGVYGFESKDPLYGIENIHTKIKLDENGHLGLSLVSITTGTSRVLSLGQDLDTSHFQSF